MDFFEKYSYRPVDIDAKVAAVKKNIAKWKNKKVWQDVLGMIDLTSLTVSDTPTKIAAMTEKVNHFKETYPQYPIPASICVYPNLAKTIADARYSKDIHITAIFHTRANIFVYNTNWNIDFYNIALLNCTTRCSFLNSCYDDITDICISSG